MKWPQPVQNVWPAACKSQNIQLFEKNTQKITNTIAKTGKGDRKIYPFENIF